MRDSLKIIPIGGLGEIGMNTMVVQYQNDAILIDCGMNFAGVTIPGVDLILPDLRYVLDQGLNLHGIVLTHGHEDHIGALPYFLRDRMAPVFGSEFTLSLVRQKLKEFALSDVRLKQIKERDRIELGPFKIEFIEVSHSIADALGMCIETPEGRIVHTGDFKIDPDPVDDRHTDLDRFKELGDEGVLLLLSDSTNVETPGESESETSVGIGLEKVISEIPGWAVVACFASHIPRIGEILRIAQKTHRKVVLAGRTMIQNLAISRKIGRIDVSDDLFIEAEEAVDLPRNRVLILSTGTQGESRSALARMAFAEHRDLRLKKGDRVVLSSRFIPGNEKAIFEIVNHLFRRGAEVITRRGCDIHVSGHAYRGDLEKILGLVRPKFFVPVHGEYRHLISHRDLAVDSGCVGEKAFLLEDGDILEIEGGDARKLEPLELEPSVVDGTRIRKVAGSVLRERRHLSEGGVIIAVALVSSESGELIQPAEFFTRGVFDDTDGNELFEEAVRVTDGVFNDPKARKEWSFEELEEELRIRVRRVFRKALAKKPVVIPVIIET